MNWLVTGSRLGHSAVEETLTTALSLLGRPRLVVLGDAPGVDRQAREWCKERGLPFTVFYADWNGLGKRAGPVRNAEMVAAAAGSKSIAFAFPRGDSRGTRGCMALCEEAGIFVVEAPERGWM